MSFVFKNRLSTLVSLGTLAFFCAGTCACTSSKTDSGNAAPAAPAAPSVPATATADTPAASDFFSSKYKSAVLVCEARLQYGKTFDPAAPPTDTLVWDLKNEFAPSRSLKFVDNITNMNIAVLVNVTDVSFVDKRLEANGATYEVKGSPELQIQLYDSGRILLADGGNVTWPSDGKANVIHERIPATLVSRTQAESKAQGALRFFENVTCLLNTELNTGYADQFKPVP